MTPHETLVHASAYFDQDPQLWAKKLAELGKSEGYDYIRPTVLMLEECHAENKACMGLLTMLRQPEWIWRSCANNKHIRFFGIPAEDGTFAASGYYVVGKFETGEVKVLLETGNTAEYVVGDDLLEDPREQYVEKKLKLKIWRHRNKYFLVMVGRIVDLLKYGFSKEDIRESGGRGYFSKWPAFAVLEGPMDKQTAQETKTSLS